VGSDVDPGVWVATDPWRGPVEAWDHHPLGDDPVVVTLDDLDVGAVPA
jgi:hypothetical protein